ncbi:MAG: hypothetical protein QM831_22085 [Kofleriaceae bacterium]
MALSACGRLGFNAELDAAGPVDTQTDGEPLPDAAVLLETITVPTTGATVTSSTNLEPGSHYALVASGTFTAVPPAVDPLADAEYYDLDDPVDGPIDIDASNMIDFGLAINETTVSALKSVRWGAYRADHVYTTDFVGAGAPITAKVFDCCYSDNTGTLTLQIFR